MSKGKEESNVVPLPGVSAADSPDAAEGGPYSEPPPGYERQHLAPMVLDTRMLRPLPEPLWDSSCVNCDRMQSRWEMGPQGSDECVFVCSLCFLYESQWGQKRRDQLPFLIHDIEAEKGERFLRTPDDRLLSCKDANDILGAIALTSRMFQVHDTIEAVSQAARPDTEGPDDGTGSRA